MTFKRAIAIGLLATAGIGLLCFGIKYNAFTPQKKRNFYRTTSPVIQTNAEDYLYPVSTKWLFNNSITYPQNALSAEFKSGANSNTAYTSIRKLTSTIGNQTNNSLQYKNTSNNWLNIMTNGIWEIPYKTIEFTTAPTGEMYTFLETNAQPAYNNDVLISNATCITEIRKENLEINMQNVKSGQFINTSGVIQLYLDTGISTIKINGTRYTNFESNINITNKNIIIETTGTPSGNTSYVFTINYYNTRPAIDPQPYPDPGERITEVLDITGLMLQILTMPFTFISQAFNLTIFAGTPYQFNFSNFILSLIAIATLLFIIKLFTSGFSVIGNYTGNVQKNRLTKAKIAESKSKTALNNRTKPNEKTTHVKKE